MNDTTVRNIGIVLFALIAILIGIEFSNIDRDEATGRPLLAGLMNNINDVNRLVISSGGNDEQVIANDGSGWRVEGRDYPADVAKVREVLLTFAHASVLEEKTSNPDRYALLGVQDPGEGSDSIGVTIAGDDTTYSLIVGNVNQTSYRYVRLDSEATSLLIDRNPELPDDASGWLDSQLIDVPTADVREVVITHADGEVLRVARPDAETMDFDAADIPEGRELSYPTVANSIGGALNNLELEDVRAASDEDPVATVEFSTFDERRIVVSVVADEDVRWVSLEGDGVDEVLAGREFRVAEFRANQLTRRWDDILKSLPETAEE